MKILILLLLPICLLAQKKGDNTIVIPSDVSMSQIKAVLFKSGYAITNTDTVFISTAEKEIDKSAMVIRIMIARIDSVTYVKAQYKSSVPLNLFGTTMDENFASLSFGGMKKSPIREAWNELDKVAKLISPVVNYIKQ